MSYISPSSPSPRTRDRPRRGREKRRRRKGRGGKGRKKPLLSLLARSPFLRRSHLFSNTWKEQRRKGKRKEEGRKGRKGDFELRLCRFAARRRLESGGRKRRGKGRERGRTPTLPPSISASHDSACIAQRRRRREKKEKGLLTFYLSADFDPDEHGVLGTIKGGGKGGKKG